MNDKEHIEDDILGRWLAGTLTDEERTSFESSEAYKTYTAIAEYSNDLVAPSYDTSAEYEKVQAQRNKKNTPIHSINRRKWMGIAASFVVLIGVGLAFFFGKGVEAEIITFATVKSETKEFRLPDNSKVNLNISSQVDFDASTWEENRALNLQGEAYFEVEKGSKFTVSTANGKVQVLGTKFNVRSRNGALEVICFEGKVKVSDEKDQFKVITAGESIKVKQGDLLFDWKMNSGIIPSWKTGESHFSETAYINVIEELENQFDIQIQLNQDVSSLEFSGFFPHDNLESAAKQVFIPMGIAYDIVEDSLIVTK